MKSQFDDTLPWVQCSCGHKENIAPVMDKRGWFCEKCQTVWEVDSKGKIEEHLFHYVRGAVHDGVRKVCNCPACCTGFRNRLDNYIESKK